MNEQYGIDDLQEVKLRDDHAFLQIKETLTRVGIANFDTKTIYQSCHILQKRGLYYIVHFKELFLLDGKCTRDHFTQDDKARRDQVVELLQTWGLCSPLNEVEPHDHVKLFVLKHRESKELTLNDKGDMIPLWTKESKYSIGENHDES